ncbi:MAG: hypothetical protein KF704_13760 [Crocinitomicaceae bacterium]|nr:hypothetical protein [Crocinitomicaceae bacterium]
MIGWIWFLCIHDKLFKTAEIILNYHMKLDKTDPFKFEIICIDPNGSANITTERSIKDNILSNEKIWKKAEYSEKYIEDKELNIKMKLKYLKFHL